MSDYREQVRSVVDAIGIRSQARFSWLRRPVPGLPARLRRALSTESLDGWLQRRVREHLYEHFYCPGKVVPDGTRDGSGALDAATRDFVRVLSAANRGQGSWQPGWRITQPGDPALVIRGSLMLRARAGEYRRAGEDVELRLRPEHLQASPGFYLAVGDQPLGSPEQGDFARLYWHTTPSGAILLMEALTEALNGCSVPFKLKTLSAPGAYRRCDAFVLYILRSDFPSVVPECARIHAAVRDCLRPGVPALTKSLAVGLGLAEDPPDGGSFGENRCDLIAGSLITAERRGVRSPGERLALVEGEFNARGLSLENPYLNPGSLDRYELKPAAPRNGGRSTPRRPADLVSAAAALSDRLCASAIWSEDQCNWIGPVEGFDSGSSSSRWTALGPELYGGTSGIAIVLAESYARSADTRVRRCALAAIRHALSASESIPRHTAGFYTGWSGIAYAAARVGSILNEDAPRSASRAIARTFSRRTDSVQEYDLMSGLAGGISALLILSELFADPLLRERAVEMGDRLVRRSLRRGAGRSWRAPNESRERIGLSHGASGAALALLELYRATQDPRYRTVALEAFRFERSWFRDGERGGRNAGATRGHGRESEPSRISTWCHGAPGLALARIRGAEITGEPTLREEGQAALESSRGAVESALQSAPGGFSLCHGLAGNADALLSGANPEDLDLVRRAAHRVIGEPGVNPRWSAPSASAPGLMLGSAGSVYVALRAGCPDISSVLIPTPIAINGAARSSPRARRPAGGSRSGPQRAARRS